MPCDYRKTAIRGTIPTAQDFRAQATGAGATILASRNSGMARSQRVVDGCDTQCQQMLPKSYPSPTPAEFTVAGRYGDGNGGEHRMTRSMRNNAFTSPQKGTTKTF
jgi:hypothetical protein